MPKVGDKEFAYTPEGIEAAKRESEVIGEGLSPDVGFESPIIPDVDMEFAPGGEFNAMDRSITEYAGGGKVGYESIGGYKKGGKVKK